MDRQNRWMSKDCERLSETIEAFIYSAMGTPDGEKVGSLTRLFRRYYMLLDVSGGCSGLPSNKMPLPDSGTMKQSLT